MLFAYAIFIIDLLKCKLPVNHFFQICDPLRENPDKGFFCDLLFSTKKSSIIW